MDEPPVNPGPENEPLNTDDISTERDSGIMFRTMEQDVMLGVTVGQYTIKRIIGSGGMGTVYEAVQQSPRRTVALKMMKRGIASRNAMRRFEYEAQTLGRLRHENIAQIYEAGTWDDGGGPRPFFAMEYLGGARTLTAYAQDKKLNIHERLALFSRICNAAHHGHQKGIIHRDLKPGNILVTSQGEPKIIDFGVARSTDSDLAVTTLQTDVGALIGTLQYMSPEQCDADPNDIDTRSDVYALGVVLYELLTDDLPYDLTNRAIHEAARIVREEMPTRPSATKRILRGDVETISLKALEKDRARRYQSAVEMRQDIERYLAGEPITARRASLGYQLQLLYRRHRAVSVLSGVVLLLLVGTIVALSWYATMQSRALKAMGEADRQAGRSQDIIDSLGAMLSAPDGKTWPRDITMEAVIDHAAGMLDTRVERLPDQDALDMGAMAAVLAYTYLSLDAPEKARQQAELGLQVLRRRFPEDHPNLHDLYSLRMRCDFAEDRTDAGLALGQRILNWKTEDLGRFSPDTLGAAWELAYRCAISGHPDEAMTLLGEHVADIRYEDVMASQQAYDALALLAEIPAASPSPHLLAIFTRAVPPGTVTPDLEQLAFVQDITWEMGLRGGHPETALEILEGLEPALAGQPANQLDRRRNRVYRGLMLFRLERYADAILLFEEQKNLDAADTAISAEYRQHVADNLRKAQAALENQRSSSAGSDGTP